MKDIEFITLVDNTLEAVEDQINELLNDNIDVDVNINGRVLEILFNDKNHIVITPQIHLKELWLAALKKGGFHYYYDGFKWIDNRGGVDFCDKLSELCSSIVGRNIIIRL
ncbi:CyaY protein [Candidatus Kinetoplastibacterium desouzaii TCC079E]|uniref:Iron-sulfur cluster assembly protein CyaY n=1 Tax=Candidatus Kinetoplastidibacterium desouzai TCC079E TaxID=1208919 RepID=M1LNK2_9PROT|nr:iron donor protein CyaY [Candidatus Kinetoplastibacterium desouzaii]AGF47252.1 CyaY protein [Candidatus Kinetoplastibacterium desouzaii TCC079E]